MTDISLCTYPKKHTTQTPCDLCKRSEHEKASDYQSWINPTFNSLGFCRDFLHNNCMKDVDYD